jgi:hypothetical protein
MKPAKGRCVPGNPKVRVVTAQFRHKCLVLLAYLLMSMSLAPLVDGVQRAAEAFLRGLAFHNPDITP